MLRSFIEAHRKNTPHEKWRNAAARMLRARGYKPKAARGFTQTMLEFALLLPWFGFMFEEAAVGD